MIELKNISCSFHQKSILENISLHIENHLTILGSNGAGKSTLAKIICDLVVFKGEVSIDGVSLKNIALKERAKLLSYIPAKLDIYDSFITVFEFVLLGRFAHKKSLFTYSNKDKKITHEALASLNITHLATHSISSLSSGETQLTLIAQALTQQSKIIIFDEPTANLDPKNSKIIAQHIKRLKKQHQIILITHDISLGAYLGTPVAFIKETKLSYYKDNFFQKNLLEELYEVRFNQLEVAYD